MTLAKNERSEVRSVSGIIPCAKHIGISREAEDSATSRELRRIPLLAGNRGIPSRGIEMLYVFLKQENKEEMLAENIYKNTDKFILKSQAQ
jgi:hypothetical protein